MTVSCRGQTGNECLLSDLRSWGTSMGAASCHSRSSDDMRVRATCPPCPNISPLPIGRSQSSPLLIGWMTLLTAAAGPVSLGTETGGWDEDSKAEHTIYDQCKADGATTFFHL